MNSFCKVILLLSSFLLLQTACSNSPNETKPKDNKTSPNIAFLAFGDGGYHPDYPKRKHILKPKNKQAFIKAEKEDWLEEHRPASEFNYAPIYVYPNTDIATEDTGALAVGQAMAHFCKTERCRYAIQLGDNIYPDGADANDGKDDQKRMNDLLLKPLLPLFKVAPELQIYSALGNHDWKSSRKGVALQIEWMAKQKHFNLDERGYYNIKIGEPGNDVEFFALDTNMLLSGQKFYEISLNPDGSEKTKDYRKSLPGAELEDAEDHELPIKNEDEVQLAWLKKSLAQSTAKWKIVYGHHVLWSVGGTKYNEAHILRDLIMSTMCQYADAYIAGHEHDLELHSDNCKKYDRQDTRPPLPLIISGAASKMRGHHSSFARWQNAHYSEYTLHWVKSFIWGFANILLDNENDTLNVTFYTTPRDGSGKLKKEREFSFAKRSANL